MTTHENGLVDYDFDYKFWCWLRVMRLVSRAFNDVLLDNYAYSFVDLESPCKVDSLMYMDPSLQRAIIQYIQAKTRHLNLPKFWGTTEAYNKFGGHKHEGAPKDGSHSRLESLCSNVMERVDFSAVILEGCTRIEAASCPPCITREDFCVLPKLYLNAFLESCRFCSVWATEDQHKDNKFDDCRVFFENERAVRLHDRNRYDLGNMQSYSPVVEASKKNNTLAEVASPKKVCEELMLDLCWLMSLDSSGDRPLPPIKMLSLYNYNCHPSEWKNSISETWDFSCLTRLHLRDIAVHEFLENIPKEAFRKLEELRLNYPKVYLTDGPISPQGVKANLQDWFAYFPSLKKLEVIHPRWREFLPVSPTDVFGGKLAGLTIDPTPDAELDHPNSYIEFRFPLEKLQEIQCHWPNLTQFDLSVPSDILDDPTNPAHEYSNLDSIQTLTQFPNLRNLHLRIFAFSTYKLEPTPLGYGDINFDIAAKVMGYLHGQKKGVPFQEIAITLSQPPEPFVWRTYPEEEDEQSWFSEYQNYQVEFSEARKVVGGRVFLDSRTFYSHIDAVGRYVQEEDGRKPRTIWSDHIV